MARWHTVFPLQTLVKAPLCKASSQLHFRIEPLPSLNFAPTSRHTHAPQVFHNVPSFSQGISCHRHLGTEAGLFWAIGSGRKYWVSRKDGELSIHRFLENAFDVLSERKLTQQAIAIGRITWKGQTAHLELEVQLRPLYRVWKAAVQVMFVVAMLQLFPMDWRLGILVCLLFLLVVLFMRDTTKLTIERFLTELEHDIVHFKVDKTTRWHEP